jgi:hypothetical protein
MKNPKNIYVQLIEAHLSFIKNLPSEDLLKLEKKASTIRFEIIPNFEEAKKNAKPLNELVDVDLIISDLYQMHDRREGEKYLLSKCSTRAQFESVAKKLDVPFQKKDNIEKLKYKIIERTIGFRLRSQAIQGNIKSGN